jgi:hypothetical protein
MTHYTDNQRPPMSKRDKLVHERINILHILSIGCEMLNKGYRDSLADTLKTLHRVHSDFHVDVLSTYVFEWFGDTYTKEDGMIVIMEDKKEMIVIIKLKSGQYEGEWRVYEVDEYDFLDDAYLRAEAQAEQDAESAYERYYDSKTIYDDPRGY